MITIRKACFNDIKAIANVRISTWKTAYAKILPKNYLNNMSLEKSIINWKRNFNDSNNITLVAECNQKGVIGFICAGQNRDEGYPSYDAEVYAIYILKEYSKQGIGTRLIKKVACELASNGYKSIIVWMLKGNTAEKFYTSLSGSSIGEKQYKIGNKPYPVIAFGLNNIAKIFDC